MAIHNEILTGRHNKLFQKLFGLKGRAPAPQLSSEISVSHPIFHGNENRFLESWNTWGVGGQQVAAAALNAEAQIRNPANSRVVAVVVLWTASSTAGEVLFQYGQQNVDKAVVLLSRALDGRVGQAARSSQCSVSIGNSNNGQVGTTIGRLSMNGNTSIILPSSNIQELVLAPGDVFLMQCVTQNTLLSFTYWWRERSLEEGELQ